MKKAVFSLLLTTLLLGSVGGVRAQGQWLGAAVGLRPDSPFYILERIKEKIDLFFTLDNGVKAQKAFGFAAERLAEAEAMLTYKNAPVALDTIKRYESFLLRGRDYLQKAEAQGRDMRTLKAQETEEIIREQAVLQNISERVPEGDTNTVLKAITTAQQIFDLTSPTVGREAVEAIIQRIEESIPQLEDILPGEFLPAFLKFKEASVSSSELVPTPEETPSEATESTQ